MKEYEKLLFEDTKRKENLKALDEVKLGLFEQKEEKEFDFSIYTKMTYHKKYKGLYDLYQNNDTMELVYVCPLVENNKGDSNERKDLAPYAYDCIYLEYLDSEAYELVRKAAIHEKTKLIDGFYYGSIVAYILLFIINIVNLVLCFSSGTGFSEFILLAGSIIGAQFIMTILLSILLIHYRKFKAQ